jgi:hypothetical protein
MLLAQGAGLVTLAAIVFPHPGGQPATKGDPAVAAAGARAKAVKTAAITFKVTEVIARGGVSSTSGVAFAPITPPDERTFEAIDRLALDGEKVRYENNHFLFRKPNWELVPLRSVWSSFDGAVAKTLFPRGLSVDEPLGWVRNSPQAEWVGELDLLPLTMTFRGLSPAVVWHPISSLRPSASTLTIDGVPCKEFTAKDSGTRADRYWLDPARDYVVRRAQRIKSQRGGQLVQQVDVVYRRHDVCGWVPASWVHRHYTPAGDVGRTMTVEILDLRLNDPQPPDLFDIRFPPGATFSDQRDNKQYRVGPDGSIREEPLTNRGGSPETVALLAEPWYRRNKWLLIGMGGLLAALGIRQAARRMRAGPSGQQFG